MRAVYLPFGRRTSALALLAIICAVLAGRLEAAGPRRRAAGQDATVRVTPQRLSFIGGAGTERLAPQRVAIAADPATAVTWTATPSAPWIVVSPREGRTPGTATVHIAAKGLLPGDYTGRVLVSVAGIASPAQVDVRVTIAKSQPQSTTEPKLLVTPAEVTFSTPVGQAAPLSFSVRVQGEPNAALAWSATVDQPWLSVAPSEGTTPAELRLTAVPGPLAAGTYEAALLVRPGRPGSVSPGTPLRIPVRFILDAAAGQLAFASPTLPTAGVNVPYAQPIPIRGGRPPYFFQMVQGQLPPELALLNGALTGVPRSSGTFAFTIAVTDSAQPPASVLQTFMMTVTVIDRNTALVVRPTEVAFTSPTGQPPAPVTMTIGSGGPPLTWRIATNAAWLKVQPAGGVAPASVTLMADTKGLAPGAYSATVTITMEGAPNSPTEVPVRMLIRQ